MDSITLDDAARAEAGEGWIEAGPVPATVHDILLRRGKIDAPWLPHGTEKCFWVGPQDWVYAVRFSVPDQGRKARLRLLDIDNKIIRCTPASLRLSISHPGRMNGLVRMIHSKPTERQAG